MRQSQRWLATYLSESAGRTRLPRLLMDLLPRPLESKADELEATHV
jgi:hypothetical protein